MLQTLAKGYVDSIFKWFWYSSAHFDAITKSFNGQKSKISISDGENFYFSISEVPNDSKSFVLIELELVKIL